MSARTLAASLADPDLVVLDGFHALKHARRFGAEVVASWTSDALAVERLRATLAPDLAPIEAMEVTPGQLRGALGRDLPTPLVSVARRPPPPTGPRVGEDGGVRVVVALVDPRHLGNVGAAVRAAAAADAGGLVVIGAANPWHPQAVRGAAGLQYALPVVRVADLDAARQWAGPGRAVVALAEGGTDLRAAALSAWSLLLFGTERDGLPRGVLDAADRVAALPMRAGVSSLNLATAVAATLYLAAP